MKKKELIQKIKETGKYMPNINNQPKEVLEKYYKMAVERGFIK